MADSANTTEIELLRGAYEDFNARRIDAVLARLAPDVEWANGMEGGHCHGRENVRAYWTRQWAVIDPRVDPVSIERDASGRFVVAVHQVVHELNGTLILDRTVHHAYRISGGLIQRMDIE
jgi:hypothetical protein